MLLEYLRLCISKNKLRAKNNILHDNYASSRHYRNAQVYIKLRLNGVDVWLRVRVAYADAIAWADSTMHHACALAYVEDSDRTLQFHAGL